MAQMCNEYSIARAPKKILMRLAARPQRSVLAAVLLIPIWATIARAESGPIAPCQSDITQPYPEFAAVANVHTWQTGDIAAGWSPADCIGWASGRFTVLTALASRFGFAGRVDELLARFGAQSAWRGMRYWSTTDRRWDVLITDAAALSSADDRRRRADFTVPELKGGADLYFLQQDNRSSDAVMYRMSVTAATDRLVVRIENISAVTSSVFTLFAPGDLRSTYIFVKLAPAEWGYYSLSGAREGAAVLGDHTASYANRATAIYRHLVGIPGDQEPPTAR